MKLFQSFQIRIQDETGLMDIELEVVTAGNGVFEIRKGNELKCIASKSNEIWLRLIDCDTALNFDRITEAIDCRLEGTGRRI